MNKHYGFDYRKYNTFDELPAIDRELVEHAKAACSKSYAPFSHFNVGAAARLKSGRIITGSNQESEVFPAGICAERSMLYYHQAHHVDDPIEALVIASIPNEKECYPCGMCRQVIYDTQRRQGSPIRVLMCGRETVSEIPTAEYLLPFTFIL